MPIYKKVYDQSFEMESESVTPTATNYSVITFETRIRLVELVCVEKLSIPKAAELLDVKVSSAKYIIRSFRRRGKIMKKFGEKKLPDEAIQHKIAEMKEIQAQECPKEHSLKRVDKMKMVKKMAKPIPQTASRKQGPSVETIEKKSEQCQSPQEVKIEEPVEKIIQNQIAATPMQMPVFPYLYWHWNALYSTQ